MGRRLLIAAAVASLAWATAGTACAASAARGPLPFALPDDVDALWVDPTGAAAFAVRGPHRNTWTRYTARAGDPRPRAQLMVADETAGRTTAWFGATTQTGLFVSELRQTTADGSEPQSVIQVIPVSPRGTAETPVTVSTPEAYAVDANDPVLGPAGAAAVLFFEGRDQQHRALMLAMRPAGAAGWLPPVPVPGAEHTSSRVLFSESGEAVLLQTPTKRGAAPPSVRRVDETATFGPEIDLGFKQLRVPTSGLIDLEAAFTPDGALHVAVSLARGFDRDRDQSRLLLSRVPAGSDRAIATALGASIEPYVQTPSLSLTPRTDGAVSLVAGRRTSGDLRIFDADGAEPPRRTSTVRIKGFTQGAKVFRRPDGGLNLVWVSATRGYEGLMGAHRGPTSRRFSTPKPLSRSVLTRGSVFLDDAVQLPDGNVAIAYSRSGKTDFDVYGLIAKP